MENLRYVAARLAGAGLVLTLEPINTRTVPGFYLTNTRQALEALDAAGADNALLQYDIFHMQIMEGDLARTIERVLPRIGHMQLADVRPAMKAGDRRDQLRVPAAAHRPSATAAGSAANTIRGRHERGLAWREALPAQA